MEGAASVSTARDERPDWQRAVYTIVAAQFLVFVGFNIVLPFMPLFIQDLGVHNRSQVALLAGLQQTCSSIGLALCSPIWGAIADRFGRKRMFLRAVGLGAFLICLTSLVQNVPQLLFLRFLIGAFTGVQAPAMALISTVAPKARAGYAVGLIQMAVYSGTFAGPLIGGLLADVLGFRRTALLGGLFLALAALGILTLVREDFIRPVTRQGGSRLNLFADYKGLIVQERLVTLLATVFCISFAVQGLPPIVPLFIQRLPNLPGAPATLTGLALGTAGLCAAIAAPTLGRLGARVGYERILVNAALAAAGAAASFLVISSFYPVLLAEVVLGGAAGGLMPTAFTMLSFRTPPEKRGSAYGASSSASAMGMAVGQFTMGLLGASLGIRIPFLAAGLMFGAIIVLSLRARRQAAASVALA